MPKYTPYALFVLIVALATMTTLYGYSQAEYRQLERAYNSCLDYCNAR